MQTVEFIYDKLVRRPKKLLQNNVIVLFSPERIRLQPEKSKKLDMMLSILLPNQLALPCTLLATFCENGTLHHILADNNTININQPINLPWKLQFEPVNRSLNTVFSIRKKQELAFIIPLNEGIEELRIKYTKT